MVNVRVTIRTQMYLYINPIFLLLSSASLKFRRQIKNGKSDLGVNQLHSVVKVRNVKRYFMQENLYSDTSNYLLLVRPKCL